MTKNKFFGCVQGIGVKMGIELNKVLDVTESDGVVTLVKTFCHRTLEERVEEFDGRFILDGEYDWGESVGREAWQW